MTCTLNNQHALVMNKAGKGVVKFQRRGGLYVAGMHLNPIEGLVGQAPQ